MFCDVINKKSRRYMKNEKKYEKYKIKNEFF